MSDMDNAMSQVSNEVLGGEPQPQPVIVPEKNKEQDNASEEAKPANYEIRLKKSQENEKYWKQMAEDAISKIPKVAHVPTEEEIQKQADLEEAINSMSPSEKLIFEQNQKILEGLERNKPEPEISWFEKDEKSFYEANPSLSKNEIQTQFQEFFRTRQKQAKAFSEGNISFEDVYNMSGGDKSLMGSGASNVPSKSPGSVVPPGSINNTKQADWSSINKAISEDPIAGVNAGIDYIVSGFGKTQTK